MRTNIYLNDKLVSKAMELSGEKTKRSVIDRALKALIQRENIKGIRMLKGKIHWEGDLDEMRKV